MDRRTGTRLSIAAGLALGLAVCTAPQWISGASADDGTAPVAPEPTRIVSVEDQLWPVDLHELTPATTAPPAVAPVAPAAEVDGAPVVQVTPEPAPAPAPAPEPAATTEPAPAPAEADAVTTGTVHVDVAAVDGASRSVSLKSVDGALVGGPVPVDGTRITFSDLADGTYDLVVEQVADGGGVLLTRTTVTVSGNELVASCDADTLDCTVA